MLGSHMVTSVECFIRSPTYTLALIHQVGTDGVGPCLKHVRVICVCSCYCCGGDKACPSDAWHYGRYKLLDRSDTHLYDFEWLVPLESAYVMRWLLLHVMSLVICNGHPEDTTP